MVVPTLTVDRNRQDPLSASAIITYLTYLTYLALPTQATLTHFRRNQTSPGQLQLGVLSYVHSARFGSVGDIQYSTFNVHTQPPSLLLWYYQSPSPTLGTSLHL